MHTLVVWVCIVLSYVSQGVERPCQTEFRVTLGQGGAPVSPPLPPCSEGLGRSKAKGPTLKEKVGFEELCPTALYPHAHC